MALGHPAVRWAATVPGPHGALAALVAEAAISALLLATVLHTAARPRLAPWTPVCCGVLVALYITFEAPLSGMSMNPARTLASAVPARTWDGFWVYALAPTLGMLAVAERHRRRHGPAPCAMLAQPCDGACLQCRDARGGREETARAA
jgi:aquaporin Z